MDLPSSINLEECMNSITEPWTPVDVARWNDQVMRLALFRGAYHWHVHEGEDELFLVLRGQITVQMRGKAGLVLWEGDLAVIPKGVEHCPASVGRSFVLMMAVLVHRLDLRTVSC